MTVFNPVSYPLACGRLAVSGSQQSPSAKRQAPKKLINMSPVYLLKSLNFRSLKVTSMFL